MYQTVLAVEFVWISMYANVIWDGLEAIVPNTLANNWIIALVSWKIFFEILYIVYELSYIQTSEEHKDFISKNTLECDFSHKQSQSHVKNDQIKNEYSFLGEGQKFSWGDSETDILPKQILCLQGGAVILLISLLKKWDSA